MTRDHRKPCRLFRVLRPFAVPLVAVPVPHRGVMCASRTPAVELLDQAISRAALGLLRTGSLGQQGAGWIGTHRMRSRAARRCICH